MNRAATLRKGLAVGAFWLVLIAGPALAAEPFSEIAAMLEGGLSEQTILDWLDGASEELRRPSAEQLLSLKRAGASERLLQELLRRSRPAPTEVAPSAKPRKGPGEPRAAAPESVQSTGPPTVQRLPRTTPLPRVPVLESGDGDVPVRFSLRYSPRFDEDEEEWDLLVYLDGHPLSYVPASSELLGLGAGAPLEFEVELPTGRHSLRLLQERHERRRKGWRHAARAAERGFDFVLAAGEAARLEVEFSQGWGDLTDPLTFRFSQQDRVADLVEVGGEPAHWPELCEESGKRVPSDDCLGWAELWPAGAPARAEVLAVLADFEFRPVPR